MWPDVPLVSNADLENAGHTKRLGYGHRDGTDTGPEDRLARYGQSLRRELRFPRAIQHRCNLSQHWSAEACAFYSLAMNSIRRLDLSRFDLAAGRMWGMASATGISIYIVSIQLIEQERG